jgi:hypothetical protein
MGVRFDRILDAFEGPFERVEGFARPPAGSVTGRKPAGYLLRHEVNDSTVAVNRLIAGGEAVYWLAQPLTTEGRTWPAGTIWIPAGRSTAAIVKSIADETGLTIEGIAARPAGEALRLHPVRVGVLDVYGGSAPSGWVQWLLTQFRFPFEVVYPPALDTGNLGARFDVLVLENGLVPDAGRGERPTAGSDPAIPEPYRDRIGAITDARTLPQLRQFVEQGGTIVAIGTSTAIAGRLGLGVTNALVEAGTTKPLPPEKFYIPGSILQARVDTRHPLGYGLPETLDMFYSNNPLFSLGGNSGMRQVAWFDGNAAVRSGWAWGLDAVKGATAVAEGSLGKGKVLLFGPPVAFRAHPHATFKLLFNGLHYSTAERVTLGKRTRD